MQTSMRHTGYLAMEDQYLLSIQWDGAIFVDRMLPFSLRLAPKYFSAIADVVQWMLKKDGVLKGLHYLDDFILVAHSKASAELLPVVKI